jgi:hypothetical protein
MVNEERQVPNPLWLITGDCLMVVGWSVAWLSIAAMKHFGFIEAFCGWFVGAALSAAASRVLLHTALSFAPRS